jgi:hypothetical protein
MRQRYFQVYNDLGSSGTGEMGMVLNLNKAYGVIPRLPYAVCVTTNRLLS